jgi:CRISPR-associated protein Cas5d
MLRRIHHGPPVRFDWFHARLDRGVLHVPRTGIPGPAIPAGEVA